MDATITLTAIVCLIIGASAGCLVAWLVTSAKARGLAHDVAQARTERDSAITETRLAATRHDGELAVLRSSLAHSEADIHELRQQLAVAQAQLEQHNESAKARDLAEAERTKSDIEQEGRVLTALSPVAQKISEMEAKLVELEHQRQTQYGKIGEQLDQARRSDESLQQATASIVSALKNNSARGKWGEAQLRNIVRSAGLLERVDFDLQASFDSTDGKRRPDMVVHIPGGKSLMVDAKVPFNAYIEADAISPAATGEQAAHRKQLLDQHSKALRTHIKQLASKEYWELADSSPDFVVAFIPSESLLSAAIDIDPTLLEYAFDEHVVLASPVTLWSVLRTVAFMWRQEDISAEADTILNTAKELYNRLATMSGHIANLGNSLQKSVTSFNSFTSSLESRVLVTARRLDKLDDVKAIARPGSVTVEPKHLSAPELTESLSERS